MVNFTEFLAEKQSETVKNLYSRFGGNLVFCRSHPYIPEQDDLKQMAKILNDGIFSGKNNEIPVIYEKT